MPILCYHILQNVKPNAISTTGAEEGHLSVLIKSDSPECSAQVYSELVANRLAMFLGLPVALGVPAKQFSAKDSLRFASLMAFEQDHEIYDFTGSDERCLDRPENAPHGMLDITDHAPELLKLAEIYPVQIAQIAVFDLWIGNEDRFLNFKAELSKGERGIMFAIDHGSSLLACTRKIDSSIEKLQSQSYPSFHPFQKLIHPMYAGEMVERIKSMPDWAIESAAVYDDVIGNVTIMDQYALLDALQCRKKFLSEQVKRLL